MTSRSRIIKILQRRACQCLSTSEVPDQYLLLALDGVGLVGLDADDAATLKLVVVNDVVCLGGQHALDVVVDITQHDSVSLGTTSSASRVGSQGLDLKTLQDGNGEALLGGGLVREDGAAETDMLVPDGRADRRGAKSYFKAPVVMACCAAAADIVSDWVVRPTVKKVRTRPEEECAQAKESAGVDS
jgi:hypothetical protein